MAVQTNDVVSLPIIFATLKFCENFTIEDNFNNTFLSKCPSLPLLARNCDKFNKKV